MLLRNKDLMGIAVQDALSSTSTAIAGEKKVRIATTIVGDVTCKFMAN